MEGSRPSRWPPSRSGSPLARNLALRPVDKALWAAAFGSLVLVAVFSLAAVPPGAQLFENADKVLHGVAYAGTSFLFLLAAVWRPGRGEGPFPWAATWIVLAACVTGLAIEIVQGHAGRQRSGLDFVADVIGVLVALGIWHAMRRPARAQGPNGGVDPDPSEG